MAQSKTQWQYCTTANLVSTKLWFTQTSSNYRAWREQMLCLIHSQGLIGFIDGSRPPPPETVVRYNGANTSTNPDYDWWRRTDLLLKGWILSSLSDDVILTMVPLRSSRDIWLEIEKRFRRLNPIPVELELGTNLNGGSDGQKSVQNNSIKYLPLYRAALRGNWQEATLILENDPDAMRARITQSKATALHIAVGTGKGTHFVEKLVGLMPEDAIEFKDDLGSTALSTAAAVGNVAAAIALVNKMPKLLYIPTKSGDYPLQVAALHAQRNMLRYLMFVTSDEGFGQRPYDGKPGLRLLCAAIDAEYFDIGLCLVKKYPYLARMQAQGSSPWLSIIAKNYVFSRRFSFWERFINSLLQNWDSPLWKLIEKLGPVKRMRNKLLGKQQALELVKSLCKEVETMSLKESFIYFPAILRAAELGIHEIVEEIVEAFPDAIFSNRPDTDQSIFHLAVENRSEHVFNLIYQMSDHKHLLSDLRDSNGNNLLHLAGKLAPSHKLNEISGAALQMQREMQWYKEVEKFVRSDARERLNKAGKSPKMVFTEEHQSLKEAGEKWMKDTANSCTIAAALIATVVFAAAITVPGGNVGSSGFPIFSDDLAFIVFAVSDAVSLFTSVTSLLMFLAILTSRYAVDDFLYVLPKRLIIGLCTLFISITFMMLAFGTTVYLVFGRKNRWVLIPTAALACLPITSFVLLQFPLLIEVIYSTYGAGIFGKKSKRPFY